jgi:spoIIIJ-associated protein
MERRTSVEIQAISVDEAVRLALEELALTRDDVEIEILVDASGDAEDEALVRVIAGNRSSSVLIGSDHAALIGCRAGARRPIARHNVAPDRIAPRSSASMPTTSGSPRRRCAICWAGWASRRT